MRPYWTSKSDHFPSADDEGVAVRRALVQSAVVDLRLTEALPLGRVGRLGGGGRALLRAGGAAGRLGGAVRGGLRGGLRRRALLGLLLLHLVAPVRRLLDAGVSIGLATDNVPTTLFYPIWHVVSRWNMISEDRIAPEQALSREDALRCGTMGGAYLTFEDDTKGSIEEGKLGDMAVLSDDPLTCAEEEIKDIVAKTTIVGGKTVYERELSK